jgi:excisionase family DNA binding protein
LLHLEKFFYGRKEAACALAISVRKIDYFISDQKLRTRRIGRRVVIPSEDVKRLASEIIRSDMPIKRRNATAPRR